MGGEQVEIEFITGGKDIEVTDDNKAEYILEKVKFMTYASKQKQIDRFLQGFWEVVPCELCRVFTAAELEQVMCGTPKIDMKDWQDSTFYQGQFKPNHPVV